MTATESEDEVWTGAGVRVRCRRQLDETTTDTLWEVYLAAFDHLRTQAAARHLLTREEFGSEMTDPRVWKYVAYDGAGHPVGLATLTDDLAAVPWVSPEFFAARYPQASARNALFYVPFVCTDPRRTRAGVYSVMYRAFTSRVRLARGVLGYDVCTFNDKSLNFSARMADWQRRDGAHTVERIDSQHYYAGIYGQDAQ